MAILKLMPRVFYAYIKMHVKQWYVWSMPSGIMHTYVLEVITMSNFIIYNQRTKMSLLQIGKSIVFVTTGSETTLVASK